MAMQILGLYDDRPYIRVAVLETNGKKSDVRSLKSFIPNSFQNVKQLYIWGWKGTLVTGISTLVRTLDFKISSPRLIEKGLPFQVESLTHMPAEDLIYASQTHSNEKGSEATIFLSQKTALQAHLERWKEFSLEPDLVTAIPQALVSFARFRCPELPSVFLVHLGSQEWTCTWMEEGKVKKVFVLAEGIEVLFSALWEDRKKVLFQKEIEGVARQIDLLQLKSHLNPHLSAKLEELRNKLGAILCSFDKQAGKKPLLFIGRTDSFGHLCEYLIEKIPEASPYEPQNPLSQDEKVCAIAIGLALEQTITNRKHIQFLKEEFIPRKVWKKTGQWGVGWIAASLFLSLFLAFGGDFQMRLQKEELTESLQQLMDRITPGGFASSVDEAISLIEEHTQEASFISQAPSVSEFLSWLTTHPLLEALSTAGDPLQILDLKYTLTSFPRIGHSKAPYEARIEIEFQVTHPMSARKLHEAFLQEDILIDSKREISWESLSDRYRAAFFLKNRIPHVF